MKPVFQPVPQSANAFIDVQHTRGSCRWFDRPDVATFRQFAVLPQFQGRGIGGELLSFVEARAKASGAKEMACDTAEGVFQLIRWYRSRGYREVDSVQWEGKTYRSIILSKAMVD